MWAGDWRRAYDYGDPQAEALAVHESAGLIDVSTLGKLIVRGPEAGAFLDRLYPNRFANLKPGRIRYGVLTSDAGRIMDDGTICRLDDESFYVTTTSSGAGAVEQWFSWWLADWRMQVTLTDVTQGLAAVNLAGPRAREIMGRLTELDCSNEAFTYLDAKRAPVAGVPALLLRIGFVGEVGYEIHFPAAHGQHVWDAILEAGAEHGIRPFGLEPQRILRLQKMHILVGQDTDSESTPFGAAMPWIVKLDKDEDFIGKWALEHDAEHPSETALVGLHAARRRRADRGRRGARRARRADRAGHERAPLAPARPSHRHGVGAGGHGQRRRRDHDLRRQPPAARRGPDQAVLRPRRRGAALVSRALEFLRPSARAVARSPMESQALAAGAQMEVRGGWNVAVAYPGAATNAPEPGPTSRTCASSSFRPPRARAGHRDAARRTTPGGAVTPTARGALWCSAAPTTTRSSLDAPRSPR